MDDLITWVFELVGVPDGAENRANLALSVLVAATFSLGAAAWAMIAFCGRRFISWRNTRRGALTGTWLSQKLDSDDNPITKDIFRIRHEGDVVEINGERLWPEQFRVTWTARGLWRNRTLVAYYAADDSAINSFGTIILVADHTATKLNGLQVSGSNREPRPARVVSTKEKRTKTDSASASRMTPTQQS